MNQADNTGAVLRKIQTTKPHLMQSFINFKECLEQLAPIDNQYRLGLLKLTYAAEFIYVHPQQLFPLLLARNEFILFSELIHTIASSGYHYARVLLESYPGMRFPLAAVAAEIRFLTQSAAALPDAGVRVLMLCLKYTDSSFCRFMLQSMAIVARYSPGTMVDCIELIYGRLGAYSPALLQQWIARGTDFITSNRVEEGIKFLLLQSGAARKMLGLNYVVLEDFRNILRIYSTSVAGKELNINSVKLSLFGLKVPYTDGATIFLPPEINFFKNPELNRQVYTVLAALQAAAVSMGTFALDTALLPFRIALRERYATMLPEIAANVRKQYAGLAQSVKERSDGELEVTFANNRKLLVLNTEHEKFFYSFPTPDFARELFTLVENTRIEFLLSSIYTGLKQDFLLVNSYFWNRRQAPQLPQAGNKRIAAFYITLEHLIQYSLLQKTKTEIADPQLADTARSVTGAFKAIYNSAATVQDSAAVMFAVYNIFFDNFPLELICRNNDISTNFREIIKPRLYPEIVLDVSPGLLKQAPASDFVSEAAVEKAREIDFSSFWDSNAKITGIRKAITAGKVKVFKYPEYDYLKNSYREQYCTLFEAILPAQPNEYYEQVLERYKLIYKKTRKRFLAMKPDDMELSRRWYSGNDIHITDTVDYCISLLRGESPDEKIYYRKILNRRDLAAAILVDASSSTDTVIGSAKIIDTEKDSLSILGSALSAIDDSFGIFSFFSLGPRNVFINIVKDFNEAWTPGTQQRIAFLKAYAGNRDGCAIRHITSRLLQEPEQIKLLILLSDGIPADIDYGAKSCSDTSQYAIEDTRRAILEARRQGIVPYCLTIDRYAKSYISHLYGMHHYAILEDVSRLPEKLSQLYLKLTR